MRDEPGIDRRDSPVRRSRSWDGGTPVGQERTVSYESEDRYWTDYLRVALPVIGLLLMLALFWWWAQQFIGDDGNANDLAQVTETNFATAPSLTATATVQVVIDSTPGADPTSTTDGGETDDGEADLTPSDGQ